MASRDVTTVLGGVGCLQYVRWHGFFRSVVWVVLSCSDLWLVFVVFSYAAGWHFTRFTSINLRDYYFLFCFLFCRLQKESDPHRICLSRIKERGLGHWVYRCGCWVERTFQCEVNRHTNETIEQQRKKVTPREPIAGEPANEHFCRRSVGSACSVAHAFMHTSTRHVCSIVQNIVVVLTAEPAYFGCMR